MRHCFLILHHPSQGKIANIVADYYRRTMGDTYLKEADFTQIPEHEQRNIQLGNLQGYDYVFTLDSDEIMLKRDIDAILLRLESDQSHHKSVWSEIIDYLSPTTRTPYRDHKPIICVDPKMVRFYTTRCANLDGSNITCGKFVHHLAFLHDKDWKRKLNSRVGNDENRILNSIEKSEGIHIDPPREVLDILEAVSGISEQGQSDGNGNPGRKKKVILVGGVPIIGQVDPSKLPRLGKDRPGRKKKSEDSHE